MTNSYFDQQENWTPTREAIVDGRYADAISISLGSLEKRRSENPGEFDKDHKGAPYYALGYAHFCNKDYVTAAYFFDAAVSQDILNFPGNVETPAIRFLRILPDNPDQFLTSKVTKNNKALIELNIINYSKIPNANPIIFEHFRAKFLDTIILHNDASHRSMVTAFISFILEFYERRRFMNVCETGSQEAVFMHLLRGCVLFESIIRNSPNAAFTSKDALSSMLKSVKSALGLSNVSTSAPNFASVISRSASASTMEDHINCCVQARNCIAHNMSWVGGSLNENSYQNIFNNIIYSILHAISILYK